MKISENLIVIPARYKSSRLPKKILADIHGYPMIYWVAKRLEKANLTDFVVAADDDIVMNACKKFNIPVVMTNVNLRNGTERVYEVSGLFPEYSNFINVQGDEPLINIEVVIDIARNSKKHAFNTAVSKIQIEAPNNPSEVKVALTRDNRIVYASRAEIPYFRSGLSHRFKIHGVYQYRRDILEQFIKADIGPLEECENIEQLRCIEANIPIYGIVTQSSERSVDTLEDLEYMQNQSQSLFDIY